MAVIRGQKNIKIELNFKKFKIELNKKKERKH